MPAPEFLDPRLTERRNPRTVGIDVASALEIVDLLNAEDRSVPDAVGRAREDIARAIELDAAECPPTFGTPPEMVVGIVAGGSPALVRSREGVEDDTAAAVRAVDDVAVSARDVVLGIAASGTTPFVRAALEHARTRWSRTVLLTCALPPDDVAAACDVCITLLVGPEALTGSTRLKAGTATKLVLNSVTTGAMIRSGRAYGNLMVELTATSEKLRDRGERIVMETCGVNREAARRAIDAAAGSVKAAIVMTRRRVSAVEARRLLAEADGIVRRVVGDPPEVVT
jgi:N-acetylmuramic acid 6-phosphate etherase